MTSQIKVVRQLFVTIRRRSVDSHVAEYKLIHISKDGMSTLIRETVKLSTDLQKDLLYGRFKKGSRGRAISLKSFTLK